MTKKAEIQVLDQIIDTFGKDSYLGMSLKDQRDAIVRDITSDIPPIQFKALREEDERIRADIRILRDELAKLQSRKEALTSECRALLSAKDHATKMLGEIRNRVDYALSLN